MSNCQDVEPLLAAFVDGEGTTAQRELVRGHLARCPSCHRAAEDERVVRVAISSCRQRLVTPASDRLRQRCVACACGPRSWWRMGGARDAARRSWVPLSFAATVGVAVVAVFAIGLNGGDRALAAQLAIDHMKCFQFSPEHAGVDPITAADRWRAVYGWVLAVPRSAQSEDLQLLDVRRCLSTQGGSAHIMYKWHGQPLSVYIINSVPKSDVHVERLVPTIGENAVIWTDAGRTYAVVGQAGPNDLTHIAHYLRESAR